MFSDSIDNKINKIKLNFDNYLNDKRKDNAAQPPVPSIRRPDQLPTNYISNAQTNPSMPSSGSLGNGPMPPSKPVELQIKQLIIQGKTIDRQPLNLKNILKEKTINIFYVDEQTRYRLQIKALDNNLELKISQQKSSVQFTFKRATRFKFIKPESGEPKWMIINNNEIKEEQITLICNKDWKTIKSCFEGIVPEEMIKVEALEMKEETQKPEGGNEREDIIDADDAPNFAMPTPQQFTDTQKFRKSLKDMKEEEKAMILMDIFKIKKQFDDPSQIDKRKLKCPIHACQKVYREISQLKTHMKKHPQLNKHGIELTDYGTYEYSYKAMDLALFLGKLYPFEMKKIIKKMKTRQIGE